jgi:hypothetical protein
MLRPRSSIADNIRMVFLRPPEVATQLKSARLLRIVYEVLENENKVVVFSLKGHYQ